jgi:hypothetical protein
LNDNFNVSPIEELLSLVVSTAFSQLHSIPFQSGTYCVASRTMGDNTASINPGGPIAAEVSKTTNEQLPYWHINVPPALRTPECPPFLQDLNPKDLGIISTPDSEYHILTWREVRSIISTNRLDLFQRVPSHLRRYLENNYHLKLRYGSVMNYVLTHRLGWEQPLVAAGKPFEKEEQDVKVLWNDWPYGIEERIVHLVVWTKFVLEDDPATGDLTDGMRAQIEDYVTRTFCDRDAGGVERDDVCFSMGDGDRT